MQQPQQRFVPRRDAADLSDVEEDIGLFPRPVQTYLVQLVPLITHNTRDDVIVQGFQGANGPFEVLFAGRRRAMASDLLVRLMACAAPNEQGLGPDEGRLEAHIEGTWRRRTWIDASGWQDGIYQLIAARWGVSVNGVVRGMQGERPAHQASL